MVCPLSHRAKHFRRECDLSVQFMFRTCGMKSNISNQQFLKYWRVADLYHVRRKSGQNNHTDSSMRRQKEMLVYCFKVHQIGNFIDHQRVVHQILMQSFVNLITLKFIVYRLHIYPNKSIYTTNIFVLAVVWSSFSIPTLPFFAATLFTAR